MTLFDVRIECGQEGDRGCMCDWEYERLLRDMGKRMNISVSIKNYLSL